MAKKINKILALIFVIVILATSIITLISRNNNVIAFNERSRIYN